MLKYKIGDKVKVLQGRDKGREGDIVKIYPKKGTAIVENINMYKKHIKATVARDGKGGVYDLPRPIQFSKLAVVDPKTKKTARIGFQIQAGKKVRINLKTGKIIDKVTKKSKSK